MNKGDKVRPNPLKAQYLSRTMAKHRIEGVVVGRSRNGAYLRIKWVGVKQPESWLPRLLEPVVMGAAQP